MIKILFFIENPLNMGGAEKVLRELVNHMDQTEFEITVQTLWPCDPAQFLAPGIRYRSVYPKKSGFHTNMMRLENKLGLIYRHHMRGDYDIEVAYLECATTQILSYSTNKKAKKIAWVHCDLSVMAQNPWEFAERTAKFYRKYDHVVCVSQKVQEKFCELYGDIAETSIVYNVVDDQNIRIKADDVLPAVAEKSRVTAVTVGRFYPQKNYLRLLKVHKQLLDEGIIHNLCIVGEGCERPVLEKYITENGLHHSVKLVGFQKNPYPFMQAADLLVCSSNYEGFSTFITEGLIIGKPIVTTDCSGMRELLGDNEYGLITPNSDEGLYEGMKKLLQDAELRKLYQKKAKQRGEKFSMQALVEANEQFFRQILAENRRS